MCIISLEYRKESVLWSVSESVALAPGRPQNPTDASAEHSSVLSCPSSHFQRSCSFAAAQLPLVYFFWFCYPMLFTAIKPLTLHSDTASCSLIHTHTLGETVTLIPKILFNHETDCRAFWSTLLFRGEILASWIQHILLMYLTYLW